MIQRDKNGKAFDDNNLPQCQQPRAAHSTAPNSIDAGLQTVIDAWDSLPDAVKAGIKAMVNAANHCTKDANSCD